MKRTVQWALTLLLAVMSMAFVQAQERTYSGSVLSGDGQPIIGASVEVVGTTTGTATGIDGKYTVNAPVGSKIKFSFLGMKSITATAGSSPTINVTLEEDAQALDDVVVVAYGTSKKKDLTGSISSVDSKLISSQSTSTVSKVLEGSIPGVIIGNTTLGQPGADTFIQVRGLGTTQGKAGALIVIDGVPNTNPNALSTLNPRDIESIAVSKDAASNSLYGSRGANGVVLVTTKKGQQGKTRITLDAKWGINSQGVPNYDRIRNPKEIYEYAWQSIYNAARYKDVDYIDDNGNGWKNGVQTMSHKEASQFASKYLFKYDGSDLSNDSWKQNQYNGLGNYMLYNVPGATYDTNGIPNNDVYLIDPSTGKLNPNATLLYYDNWEDEFNHPSFRQEYNISASGATEKTDYFLSAGYLNDPSYITGSKFDRYSVRVNVNTMLTKWLKGGINMNYTRTFMQQPGVRWGGLNPGPAAQNVFYWMNGINGLKPLWARNADGSYKLDADGNRIADLGSGETDSPLGPTHRDQTGSTALVMAKQDTWKNTTDYTSGRGYVEATFLKDFKFTANVALDNSYIFLDRYNNKDVGEEKANGGRIRQQYFNYLTINTQQLLTWSHDYGKHHIDALIGHEYYWYQYRQLQADKKNMLINGMDDMGNAIGINGTSGSQDKLALEGYFARVNYNYASKYYFSASIRGDGSSKFKNADKRWGCFWSVGGAWRPSGESWLSDAEWLTDLKLRADYGTMGNQNGVGNYAGYNLWNLGNAGDIKNPSISITQGTLGNADLTWETVKTFDIGLDFRLWDRFYGSIDYYIRNTHNMIWARPNASSTGVTSKTENTASMRNSGIEIDLGVDIIKTPNVLWSFNVNGTHYENKLTALPPGVGLESLGGCYEAGVQNTANIYLRGVGKSYYNLYIAKYAGVDQKTGLAMLYHTVDAADHTAKRWTDQAIGTVVTTTDGSLATRYEAGDATADFIGGFGTSFTYKNFDFSATFSYQIGGKFFSREVAFGGFSDQTIGDMTGTMWQDAWTPTNRGSNLPMRMVGATNYGVSYGSKLFTDLALFDASYLSVKNLTAGYNMPHELMERWGLGGIRFYVSLDNMWLISRCKGMDPRLVQENIGDAGTMVDPYTYPAMRTCSLGINVTF